MIPKIDLTVIRRVSKVHDPINAAADLRWWFISPLTGKKTYAPTRKIAINKLRNDVRLAGVQWGNKTDSDIEQSILEEEETEANELAFEKATHGYPKGENSDERK